MNEKACPKCGEVNPLEVVMCWNCYAPLMPSSMKVAERIEPKSPWAKEEYKKLIRQEKIRYYRQHALLAVDCGLRVGLGALVCVLLVSLELWSPMACAAVVGGFIGSMAFCGSRTRHNASQPKEPGLKQSKRVTDLSSSLQESASLNEEEPIVRIANMIMLHALKDNATEILIEPQPRKLTIRYRIEGQLREQMKVPYYVLEPLVEELKHRADLDISETRHSQEGLLLTELSQQQTLWRVAMLPSPWGESVVMKTEEYQPFDVTHHPLYAKIGQ